MKRLIGKFCSALLFFTLLTFGHSDATAAPVTSNNNAICNQTVGNASGVTATRLAGGDCLIQFTSTGSNSWNAPTGITSIQFLVVGGGGGGGIDAGSGGGGGGGYQDTDVVVTGNTSYSLYVGNGGGAGNYGVSGPFSGESSTITIGSTTFAGLGGAGAAAGLGADPQPAVAAGGSFQGSGGTGFTGSVGGAGIGWLTSRTGPGYVGVDGYQSLITGTSTYFGGSGAGGGNTYQITTVASRSGGLGGGGNAVSQSSGTYTAATAGTANTGGGGGAGMAYASSSTYKSSAGGGSGTVIIRYTPITLYIPTLNIGVTSFTYRQPVSITANTTIAGAVTFKANGKNIPGCRSLPSNAGNSFVATCIFKPAYHGMITISESFIPTDSTYQSTQSTASRISSVTRSGKR